MNIVFHLKVTPARNNGSVGGTPLQLPTPGSVKMLSSDDDDEFDPRTAAAATAASVAVHDDLADDMLSQNRSDLAGFGGLIDRPLSPLEMSPPPPAPLPPPAVTAPPEKSPAVSSSSGGSSSSRRPGPRWQATPVRRQSNHKEGEAGEGGDR